MGGNNSPNSQSWPQKPLGQVATIERTTLAPDDIPPGTPYVGLENIDTHGSLTHVPTAEAGAMTPKGKLLRIASPKFCFDSGHLLYGKLRPYLRKIARPDFAGVCSTDLLPIRPSDQLDRSFLHHYLRHPHSIEWATAKSTGGSLPRISPQTLAEFPVPLPPLETQRRIAAILDRAAAICRKRQETMRLTTALLRSAFLELFGDPLTNPRGWEVRSLSTLVHPDTVITYGMVQAGPHIDNGVPYIRTGDIKNGQIITTSLRRTAPELARKFQRSTVHAGDLVISIRATVGTAALVPPALDGANLTQGTAKISPGPAIEGHYLLGFIQSEGCQRWLQRQVKGVTFREITVTTLRQMPVMVPPLPLQLKFKQVAERISRRLNALSTVQAQEVQLFNALFQQAFRGEL